ncbi:MAG: hypothetical protein H7Z74_00805 [Anaerolineae bacterium]|nr:hypothetical protein [Gemmatimonadaceae bacterium]
MSGLYLYDDFVARGFEPFALTRPISELRSGVEIIRIRWESALRCPATGSVVASHLGDFEELDAPPPANATIPAGSILANSRCVVPLELTSQEADVWMCRGLVAAVRLRAALAVEALASGETPLESLETTGNRRVEIEGRWLTEVWSFITDLAAQLQDDIGRLGPTLDCVTPAHTTVLGHNRVFFERGATIEPMVIADATDGPILVRSGASVRAFTRLGGPVAIGKNVKVLGDRVAGSSIGEMSIVRGEISDSVMLGHSNKAHDGFVGHSYLGRWVNLGAGTTTSNMKNTYGSVGLWTPLGMRDSGAVRLGSFFGDHVKTGIGLRLTTGSVVGAGSNIYGGAIPPKYVPPFSWGEGEELGAYDIEKFLLTAERAMTRRHVGLGGRGRRQLVAACAKSRRSTL